MAFGNTYIIALNVERNKMYLSKEKKTSSESLGKHFQVMAGVYGSEGRNKTVFTFSA